MASLSAQQILARRTFANVAASANPTSPSDPTNPLDANHAQLPQPPRVGVITPAIPRKLIPTASNEVPKTPSTGCLETTPVLANQVLSGTSDESITQISSSDDSAKPPSLDGKSVASVTTFAMDEKESLRPDDSASVKAIEDEDIYSPPSSAVVGPRMDSDTGAFAFQDQLQEITSRGPALRQSRPTSRPDSSANPPTGVLYVPPTMDSAPSTGYVPPPSAVTGKPEDLLPDSKLLEALNSPRDRIWVLKLEQDIIDFVTHSKESTIDLPQCNSFYRMLAHKLADYYFLGHAVDGSISAVRLFKTPTCRIAPPLSAFNSPSTTTTSTPPPTAPQMKILRRGGDAPLNGLSKSGSDGGDSADSDKNKAPLTREQREQRYEEARLRILGSAKPVEDVSVIKEKDESRSSSATGKKKTKKQRSNSDDDFEARSAYSTFTTPQGGPAEGGAAMYYPTFPNNTPGMYGAPAGYPSQSSYSAVYGPTTPSQAAPYPWLQQGYSGYNDPGNQSQPNGNDLATDFQAMSFQGQTGPTPPPSQAAPYGYSAPQAQQQHPSWPQPMSYQPGYPGSPGYAGQFSRPASSASHGSATHGYPYAMPPNQSHMQDPYMGYSNQAMAGFNRAAFNPQSQAFIPGYQPHYGTAMSPHNNMGFGGSFSGPPALQRQNSTQSQASSYNGRVNQDNNRPTHPLPQPVFSPHVPMPFQNAQRQPGTPNRTGSNPVADKAGPQGNMPGAPSSIAKWGTPASLPAKPPPPAAGDSFDMSRLSQTQRSGAPFAPGSAGRLPGVGGQNFHALPPMIGLRGGTTPRNVQ